MLIADTKVWIINVYKSLHLFLVLSHQGLDVLLSEGIEQVVVVADSVGVHEVHAACGQDARPGKRETVEVYAKVG